VPVFYLGMDDAAAWIRHKIWGRPERAGKEVVAPPQRDPAAA
jgi:hypothetical protein